MKEARPLEKLSKRQRARTPRRFAEFLVAQVRWFMDCQDVAVLWVQENSEYAEIPGVDCWPKSRDAKLYAGPHPIIAHPPCGPWGNYKSRCHQSKEDGVMAIELVHRWGGIVEQPVGSSLFRIHGLPLQPIVVLDQYDYGHAAIKRTSLYYSRGLPCA